MSNVVPLTPRRPAGTKTDYQGPAGTSLGDLTELTLFGKAAGVTVALARVERRRDALALVSYSGADFKVLTILPDDAESRAQADVLGRAIFQALTLAETVRTTGGAA